MEQDKIRIRKGLLTPERWQQIEKLYYAALEYAPEDRTFYLERNCNGDGELQREVESLLAQGSGHAVLEQPAFESLHASLASADAAQLSLTEFGPYKIDAAVGAGAMGRVLRATDTRLGRKVAIKILHAHFSARFERECKAISSLNHPNICTLYDVGPNYLVMELVEGESLAARLKLERLTVNTALEYGAQIAEALEAAHEKAVIHRDLKPANIMITHAGLVKVLDFGLAKTSEASTGSQPSQSPGYATLPGLILGTPAYMSPEQATGKPLDRRCDIWSFGVVLYEMLTGRRLFEGDTVSHTMAAVLTGPIDFSKLPGDTPRIVRELLARCLDRDVRTRLRDIGEARVTIRRYLSAPTSMDDPVPASIRRSAALSWAGAATFALIAAAFGFLLVRQTPAEAPLARFSISAPPDTTFGFNTMQGGFVEVSPDGRRLVFSAIAEGRIELRVRDLASLNALPVAGTEGAAYPFWSADSQNIGFFADGKLKWIPAVGGPPVTVCNAPDGLGGTWSRDGVIVFAPESQGPIYRVPASGGAPSPVTTLDSKQHESSHRWPWFLPDGRHFLFTANGGTGRVLRSASLESSPGSPGQNSRVILPELNATNVAYSQGYLLFSTQNTLLAQPFDAGSLAITGRPVPLAEHVQQLVISGRAAFGVSPNGLLTYKTGPTGESQQLVWFDRGGKRIGTLGEPANLNGVRLSPDGKSAVVNIVDASTRNKDLWIYDVTRRLKTRFTFDPAEEREAIWSPDGRWIAFNSGRKGHYDLYRKASDGTGAEELLYEDGRDKYPTSFSPDGKLLLYMLYVNAGIKSQLWLLPVGGKRPEERTPIPFRPSAFNSAWGQFSPDGRWIAFSSDESRRNEIYVAPFPGPGGKKQISTTGGDQPLWRRDGKEIYYATPNGDVMAVEVSAKGDALEAGPPRRLFGPIPALLGHGYDVSADGRQFLVRTDAQADEPLTLVQNWTALLKR